MKSQKIIILLIFVFVCFQIHPSQGVPKAELIDNFSRISCDDFLMRLDVFYGELLNDPTSQGYVVIYGDNADLRIKLVYELWTGGSIRFRNFDVNRIKIIRGIETRELNIQLWKIPAGGEKTDFKEAGWDFTFAPKTKPYIFYDEFNDQICSSVPFEKVYAEYLNANPNAFGHIVIYGKSRRNYQRQKNETQILLKDAPQNRLRFFQIRDERENVEYWLVPRKKKK